MAHGPEPTAPTSNSSPARKQKGVNSSPTIKLVPESTRQVGRSTLKITCEFPEIPSSWSSSLVPCPRERKKEGDWVSASPSQKAARRHLFSHLCSPAAAREGGGRSRRQPPPPRCSGRGAQERRSIPATKRLRRFRYVLFLASAPPPPLPRGFGYPPHFFSTIHLVGMEVAGGVAGFIASSPR